MKTRISVKPHAGWTTLLLIAACSSNPSQTMVTPGRGVATEEGTVAVSVTRIDADCKQENRCAEVEAIRTLLFVGVPGSTIRRAMVADETTALKRHAGFFERLFEKGDHARYITRSMRGQESENGQVWTVVINYEALRIALEKEGVIRKFGF